MASPAAFEPVEQYLRDVWNRSPLVFENESPVSATNGETFILVEMFGRSYQMASLGAEDMDGNLWREDGTLLLHVLMPIWVGTRQGRRDAWELACLLTRNPIPGIRFGEAAIGAGERIETDGNYARMTVSIEWERDD